MSQQPVPEAPAEFVCPITHQTMFDPVILIDGHNYERVAIQAWLDAGRVTSPVTRQRLLSSSVYPNRELRARIETSVWRPTGPPEVPSVRRINNNGESPPDMQRIIASYNGMASPEPMLPHHRMHPQAPSQMIMTSYYTTVPGGGTGQEQQNAPNTRPHAPRHVLGVGAALRRAALRRHVVQEPRPSDPDERTVLQAVFDEQVARLRASSQRTNERHAQVRDELRGVKRRMNRLHGRFLKFATRMERVLSERVASDSDDDDNEEEGAEDDEDAEDEIVGAL